MKDFMRYSAVAGLTLGLVACSSSSSDDDNNTVPTPPTPKVIENPPILQIMERPDEEELLRVLSRYDAQVASAEISAYDPLTKRAFIVSGDNKVEVVDISDPAHPYQAGVIDLSDYGSGANSVSIKEGTDKATDPSILAVALSRDLDDVEISDSGFGSGMAEVYDENGMLVADQYYLLTDRGPNADGDFVDANGDSVNAKIFPAPTLRRALVALA